MSAKALVEALKEFRVLASTLGQEYALSLTQKTDLECANDCARNKVSQISGNNFCERINSEVDGAVCEVCLSHGRLDFRLGGSIDSVRRFQVGDFIEAVSWLASKETRLDVSQVSSLRETRLLHGQLAASKLILSARDPKVNEFSDLQVKNLKFAAENFREEAYDLFAKLAASTQVSTSLHSLPRDHGGLYHKYQVEKMSEDPTQIVFFTTHPSESFRRSRFEKEFFHISLASALIESGSVSIGDRSEKILAPYASAVGALPIEAALVWPKKLGSPFYEFAFAALGPDFSHEDLVSLAGIVSIHVEKLDDAWDVEDLLIKALGTLRALV